MKTKRFISLFIFSVFLLALAGIVELVNSQRLIISSDQKTKYFKEITTAATEISSYVKRAEGHLMLYLTLHREIDKAKFPKRLASLNEQITILDNTIHEEEARKILNSIITNNSLLESAGNALILHHDQKMAATGSFRLEDHEDEMVSLHDLFSAIRRSGVELATLQIHLENNFRISLQEGAGKLRTYLLLIIFCVSIFIAWTAKSLLSINKTLNNEINARKQTELSLREEKDKLAEAIKEVKTLGGLIPICSSCKKVRSDKGYWNNIETFISEHSDATFSHSICPDCTVQLYPKHFKTEA